MSEDVKPRHWTLRINSNNDGSGYLYSGDDVSYPKDDYLKVVELEPTLQLMKEMGEALKENGLSHDFDCGISVNGRHECSCGYLKSKEVLEKYRKFKEGLR